MRFILIAGLLVGAIAASAMDTNTQRQDINLYHNMMADPRFDVRLSNLLSQKVLQFAQDIGKVLLNDSNGKSEVFSPLSIFGATSLLLLGASGRTHQELMQLMGFESGNCGHFNHRFLYEMINFYCSEIDAYLKANPWKIHEEFGLMIEDIATVFGNPSHQRSRPNWNANRTRVTSNTPSDDWPRISIANGIFAQNGIAIRPEFRDAVQSVYRATIYSLDFVNDSSGAINFIDSYVLCTLCNRIRMRSINHFVSHHQTDG